MIEFILRAPLQSWGTEKVRGGDYFPTDSKPTWSGIVGLIACVMGLERNSARIKEINDSLDIYVLSIKNEGIMTDFHIISASEKRPQYLANGKNSEASAKQGMITYRNYIQGGEFKITLDGSPALLEEIKRAFYEPHWTPYLGRKSCSPSLPILPVDVAETAEGSQKLKALKYQGFQ